jgi:hypothetical protein
LVSVAVAVSVGNVSASAFVGVARSVADSTFVEHSDAVVDVVADAVCVRIHLATAPAQSCGVGQDALAATWEQVKVWIHAAAVVHRNRRIVVARARVCATSKHTAAVVCVGVGIEVCRTLVYASADHVGVESHVESQVVLVVALRKDLNTHGTAEVAVSGELGEQHALFRACDGVRGGPRTHSPTRSVFTLFHEPLSRVKHTFPA